MSGLHAAELGVANKLLWLLLPTLKDKNGPQLRGQFGSHVKILNPLLFVRGFGIISSTSLL